MGQRPNTISLQEKHYSPENVEEKIYHFWEENQVFSAKPESGKPPFSIVIPPPNITGRLHMGHALNNSIQDSLIRYKRMDGFDALWVPGTDHAGISTQSVVKKHLDAQGINYLELGREKMIERIWEWRQKYGDHILLQLRRLGCSCDWSRTRFTMDEGLSRAVKTAFKKLYDEGLIYRGKYIVNWCPVDRTALSDDEVSTAEGGEAGHLWHFKYTLADGSGEVIIATTRPETMLGDSAVAVNPKDNRYQDLVGKKVLLPIVGREIPIIADDYVDREFGTGCLKVTPAHDVNDFQIGLRHKLPQINVMNPDGTMGDCAPEEFHGVDRFKCRELVVAEMEKLGLLVKTEERQTPIGRAQRSGAIIEYRLSDQWFVRMQPLAKRALKASADGTVQLFPTRFEGIYSGWLENIRDWCISRQIWWGHRIPAWYHKETGEVLVSDDTPEQVLSEPELWEQDKDVLDTWFSAGLWPLSTLGWPEETNDLARYYPTSVLSTAKDIIYFWVARMVMMGLNCRDEVPFHKVYFHPVICDSAGETMSKSKGNGIDPLHVIAGASTRDLEGPVHEARPERMDELLAQVRSSYPQGFKAVGADALRFTLLSLNSQAQQVQLSLSKFEEVGQRFVDKLWNASRFAISHLETANGEDLTTAEPTLEDLWILGRLDRTVAEVRRSFDSFSFNEASTTAYRFFWEDLCDWYIELAKPRLRSEDPAERRRAQLTLGEVLAGTIRLLHPIVPFITETLWGLLRPILESGQLLPEHERSLLQAEICALLPYPTDRGRADNKREEIFSTIQNITREIRNIRSHANISPAAVISAAILTEDKQVLSNIQEGKSIIERAASLSNLEFVTARPEGMTRAVLDNMEIFADISSHIDVPAELRRNQNALSKLEKDIAKYQGKLGNKNFLEKAPESVRLETEQNLAECLANQAKILENIRSLEESHEQ
jgi:valyl-tRNA synthetase